MQLNWSLKEIYSGFDAPEFISDFDKLEADIATLNQHADTLKDVASVEFYFKLNEEIQRTAIKLYSFSSLTFSTDTSSQKALQTQNKLRTIFSKATVASTKLTIFLSKIDNISDFIQSSAYLKQFEYILTENKLYATHLLSEAEEILASKLSITGSSAWTTLQQKLTSTLKCTLTLDGETKTLPITMIRNLASDASQEVRKSAYEAELEAYQSIDEAVAMSLNSIKGEVLTMSALRGFSSPLQMTLEKSRMTEKTLNAMMHSIEKSIPSFQSYLKTKAKLLGHDKGLPFYDLFAPVGTASKKFTYEEGCKFVVDNFAAFSDKLSQVASNAIEKGWIDVAPKEGKVSGAFCASLHPLGEFRVLLNYTGNLGDVTTMAHELGHGYHAICTNEENILNIDYPMPLAETASTFCETIVNNAALNIATKEEAITILENSLQDATQVICDIYSRYLFETDLFASRNDHPLSVDELKTTMLNAQKSAYGDGLDHNFLHPYMWLIKPHYYSADLNFYNFPYAFGLLFAKGLYAKYTEDPEFFKSNYDKLLAASGKMSIVDVCKIMSINVEDEAFWDASLEIIKKDITKFVDLAGDLS
ncbi:M3 family oligoendopeptidase [Fusibacter bizertensis]|uniref:M3 family oligoendopeptidase n=1 Tax=Fusibacter bizertensis TaxID=1488331 RepID=A0ABT6NGQ6_9FIRM|nr:M3 family oligoendopeptidase [Fusibacter bizertensis]MDH8679599.1 M3 family oligoendopeptidase [Fusibacter bizertensis]